jgi:hypothetical protein
VNLWERERKEKRERPTPFSQSPPLSPDCFGFYQLFEKWNIGPSFGINFSLRNHIRSRMIVKALRNIELELRN